MINGFLSSLRKIKIQALIIIKYTKHQKILPKYAEWMTAESPQILTDQKLKSFIYIKAVDKFGNERIEIIPPKNPQKWYENYIFGL